MELWCAAQKLLIYFPILPCVLRTWGWAEWRDQVSSVSAGQTFGELALVQKYEALQIYKFSAESVCSFLQFTVPYCILFRYFQHFYHLHPLHLAHPGCVR